MKLTRMDINADFEFVPTKDGRYYYADEVDHFLEQPLPVYIVIEIIPGKETRIIGVFSKSNDASTYMNTVIRGLPSDAITEYGIEEWNIGEWLRL